MSSMITQRAELTFRHNLKLGRHGWLRLTPAYSVKVVQQIIKDIGAPSHVLDPFSGTGTTGLVCAEQGIACDLIELNPFLVWLARTKTRNYTETELAQAWELARQAAQRLETDVPPAELWIPPLHHIERWWSPTRLTAIANLFRHLQDKKHIGEGPVLDLALIAFCRVAIEWSNAAFDHQSMSFKNAAPTLMHKSET